jgi:hypothetical protein
MKNSEKERFKIKHLKKYIIKEILECSDRKSIKWLLYTKVQG